MSVCVVWLKRDLRVSDHHVHEPHRMSQVEQAQAGCRIGVHYPHPVVPNQAAMRDAKRALERVRRSPEARRNARAVHQRHGSRRPRRR